MMAYDAIHILLTPVRLCRPTPQNLVVLDESSGILVPTFRRIAEAVFKVISALYFRYLKFLCKKCEYTQFDYSIYTFDL
jgi:hypothetical protein